MNLFTKFSTRVIIINRQFVHQDVDKEVLIDLLVDNDEFFKHTYAINTLMEASKKTKWGSPDDDKPSIDQIYYSAPPCNYFSLNKSENVKKKNKFAEKKKNQSYSFSFTI